MKAYECIVFWHGFPACGHMLIHLSTRLGSALKVYATKPSVPFTGMGGFLSNNIEYLNEPDDLWSHIDRIRMARIFIHTGWNFKAINEIDALLNSSHRRPKIYILVDNRLKYSLRQVFGAVYYRFKLRQLYDGAIVAGASSARLMRFLGEPHSRVASGHYGASGDLYPRWDGEALKQKSFVFVGSLDRRKGVDLLASAWKTYKENGGTWSLTVYGSGSLACLFAELPDVTCYGFAQPPVISRALLKSYAFILPSRDDNWGTVVAEAAASGCALISTREVGATEDFIIHRKNGFIIPFLTSAGVYQAIMSMVALTDNELNSMCAHSVEVSKKFDSPRLTAALEQLVGVRFDYTIIS